GSGLVRLGYIDPGVIEDIILDPENARIPVAVVEDRGVEGKRFYRVVHVDEGVESEMAGKLIGVRKREGGRGRYPVEGDFQWVATENARAKQTMRVQENRYAAVRVKEFAATDMTIARKGGSYEWEDENGVPYDGACFLFRVNNVMNSKYGWPDLLHLIDWLDQADMFFFDVAERIFWLTAFVWDVLYAGLDEDEIREKVAMEPAPKRGSIRGHNESVAWTAVAPDLGQADMETAGRMLLHLIAGVGFACPETWLGASQTTRYAGAKEAVAPARKVLEARQSYIQSAVKLMTQFQVDQAILARQLPEDVDTSFVVTMPDISKEDVGDMAGALKTISEGLMIALAAGLVDRPAAIAIFSKVVNAAGVDVEIKEEMSLEEVKEAREVLRILQKLEAVEIGAPLKLEDLLSGSEISTEDLKRIRHEWGDFLAIAGIDEEE
ncbi:MAG: hypothetical protein ABIH46_01590, partial [Chloroflexota bacterium]